MKKRIKIGVIPAAGEGTRMGYLSNLLPKTLFPLYDRPIIHYVINQMESLGVQDIYIIVNVHKEKIIDYLKSVKNNLKAKLHFIEQKKLDGTANAIFLTKKYIKEPFLLIWGDDCTLSNSLKPMIDLFFKIKPVVVTAVIKEKDRKILQQTCCVKLNKKGQILAMLEKPKRPPNKIRGCGLFIFSPEIFEFIKKTPHYRNNKKIKEINDTIHLAAQTGQAYGYLMKGFNVNINDYDQLLKAALLIKKNSP